jgi:heme/copper-type cytochrome/quinol oxidase subunit 2
MIFNKMTIFELASLMGVSKPANDTMYGIVLLLSEMTILLTFIFFGVFLALAYIVDVFNAENNPYPRHFEKTVESTLDVLFVIFPTVIIIYMLIPSLGFIFNNETAVETIFDIDVIGHQWYRSYEFSFVIGVSLYDLFTDDMAIFNKIEFDSLLDQEATYNRLLQVDKRVIIPVNTLINVTVTAQDVIHSWSIPQLGIKYDAIPGRVVSFVLNSNVTGTFYGQCSELCGVNHAFMPICVQVVDADIFLDWVLFTLNVNPSRIILNSIFSSDFSAFNFTDMFKINEPHLMGAVINSSEGIPSIESSEGNKDTEETKDTEKTKVDRDLIVIHAMLVAVILYCIVQSLDVFELPVK